MQKLSKKQQVCFSSHPPDFHCISVFPAAFERLGQEHCGEVAELEEFEELDEDGNEEEEDAIDQLEEAMSQLKSKGIFAVRCAAHSLQVEWFVLATQSFLFYLQLVLKDFQREISVVGLAVEGIEALLLEPGLF